MESAQYDVIVIGGGPAGMMAAGRAAECGASVLLLEKNPETGKKLMITGGGRCNILHAEFDDHALVTKYGQKGKVLFSPFATFGSQMTWDFFEGRGLKLKIEAEQRAFPKSDSAADVHRTMMRYMLEHGVQVKTGCTVTGFEESGGMIKKVIHTSGSYEAKNYILATGGKSRPETGSTGDGFGWLASLGHTVTEPAAALVPVTVRNPWVQDVSGISLTDVKLTVLQNGERKAVATGKMLFTHVGLSGPLVLNMSKNIGALLKDGPVLLSVDLFPSLDHGALDRKLLEIFGKASNKMIKNNIGEITQPRLAKTILALAGVDPETPLHQLTKDDRASFVSFLKDLPLSVSGLLGEDKAIVTGGGVSLDEVDFKSMRSKKVKNLYLAGDILDFDRPSGGFSLQICWTTGYVAGSAAASSH